MAESLERPCETGIDLWATSAGIRHDLQRFGAWLGDLRVLLIGLLVVLLSVSLMTAWSGQERAAASHLARAPSFSGDDAYDPAAGSLLALLTRFADGTHAASYSGDDAYDPAAGARPARAFLAAPRSYSGDDAYDLAAGSRPALFSRFTGGSYSGDDDYDPAAGGVLQ